jgi:2-amino-4-hydroxy-6-hydroxymethyldihydropteridine diphosphokinase
MARVYLALGSNVEPIVNLQRAVAALRERYPGLRCSPAYRNPAVGFAGEDFINLVVGFDTPGDSPEDLAELVRYLHEVEARCGRMRDAPKWAPRSMDLDVLLYGDRVGVWDGTTLPRPDLSRRPYMLRPIAELAPDLEHPTLHRSMRELWANFPQEHLMTPVELA